jgi:hypothetical protein
MGDVVALSDMLSRRLASELGLSVEFVDACAAVGIRADQGKAFLRWFLRLTPSQRAVVMKGTLREVKRAKPRKLTPATASPRVETPATPPPDAAIESSSDPILARAHLYASLSAAQAHADVSGVLTMNPAAYAGQQLLDHEGDAAKALATLPAGDQAGPFIHTVRDYLAAIATEDGASE